jgi:hypothetical protein
MRRFVTTIVLIFAFASLAGMTTGHAHRYHSAPMVVLNHVDASNQSIPVVVAVQRGDIDLGSGIVMPCGSHIGIPVTVPPLPACPEEASPLPGVDDAMADWSGTGPLRPPKQA